MGVGRDGLMAKAAYKQALWTSTRQQGGTDDGSDQFPRTQKAPIQSKRPHHTKKEHMKMLLSRLEERGLFMVCEEGSHRLGPPSNKALKEGGIHPHPPSFEGGSREPGT